MNAQQTTPPVVNLPTPHPYQQVVNVLALAFDHFNAALLNGGLDETPIIAVMPRGRRAAYGWFCSEKWKDKGTKRPEINISAEYLNRPIENVFGTLIHEMAHMYNAQEGIKDCNAAQYHNKHFKAVAEQMGLVVTRVPGKGWAQTTVGTLAKAAIDTFCQTEDTTVFTDFERLGDGGGGAGRTGVVICTVPVHAHDKAWIEAHAGSCAPKMSQKDVVSMLIAHYEATQTATASVEPPEQLVYTGHH